MIAPRISPLPSTAAQLLPSSPTRPDRPSVPRTPSSLYRNFLAFTRHTFSGDRARQRPPSKTPRPNSSPHSAALPATSSRNGALMPKSRISLTAPAIRNSSRFTARRKLRWVPLVLGKHRSPLSRLLEVCNVYSILTEAPFNHAHTHACMHALSFSTRVRALPTHKQGRHHTDRNHQISYAVDW